LGMYMKQRKFSYLNSSEFAGLFITYFFYHEE